MFNFDVESDFVYMFATDKFITSDAPSVNSLILSMSSWETDDLDNKLSEDLSKI